MNYYLITKWFGCFLINEHQQIVKKNIFPTDIDQLMSHVFRIRQQQILQEEQVLSKNCNPIVAEKRLQSIGMYEPNHDIFYRFTVDIKEYGFSRELLHTVFCNLTSRQVNTALMLPDYQIIQQVNALDELQHIANVLSERIAAWNMYPINETNQIPVTTVLETVEKNLVTLKGQIETSIIEIAPNVSEITGPMIAARLLSCAGSLRKLAMLPSSSIQLLGAEKALFRFKKQGGKPPKHGVIFQHPYISKAPFKSRGKHARLLSAKISIAAKADKFTKRFIAPELKADLVDKIKNN